MSYARLRGKYIGVKEGNKVKAAVFHGPYDIRVEDVPEPELGPDGILIKVKTCGICGTEIHTYKGKRQPIVVGRIMGHEYSGDVIEVGANVTGIKKGDRVAAAGGGGAFAEYVSVPVALVNKTVFPFSDKLSYEEGACTEPLSVGVVVVRNAEPEPGDTVLVMGVGMIGHGAMQVFKARGVSRVIVSDISKKRLEIAKAGGADVVINAVEEDTFERVRELTSGKGADIVADCAGASGTLRQAIEMARWGGESVRRGGEIPIMRMGEMLSRQRTQRSGGGEIIRTGGKVMMAATYEETIPLEQVDQDTIIYKDVRLIGCLTGALPEAMSLMKAGKVNLEPIFTHEFPLDKTKEAFDFSMSGEGVKVMVNP